MADLYSFNAASQRDREFTAFKGFPVSVTLTESFKGKTVVEGSLHDRDDEVQKVNAKGRMVSLPLDKIKEIRLVQDQTQMP